MNISNIIIPLIILIVLIMGLYKKVNVFNSFLQGVKEGLETTLSLFPTIFAMVLAITIITKSNLLNDISYLLEGLFNYLKFPSPLLPLAILRPISGSSSLFYLSSILEKYGPDSIIGMIGSIIQSGTDTTIYIIGLYYGAVGIKKIRYSLLLGLLVDLLCIVFACIIINISYS